jgi:hypothetical protein
VRSTPIIICAVVRALMDRSGRMGSVPSTERVDFHDLGTSSAGFMILRNSPDGLAIGFGIEADGDLDLFVSRADAKRLGNALIQAADAPD